MTAYLIRRGLSSLATVLILLVCTFSIVRFLPGDVIDVITEGRYTKDSRQQLEQLLGLDRPAGEQFVRYSGGVLRGDLGRSMVSNRPILPDIMRRIGATAQLAVMALLMSSVIGMTTGLVAAVYRGTAVDYAIRALVILFLATPGFWIATIVLVYGALWFSWSPPQTYVSLFRSPLQNLQQYMIPAAILGLALSASISRLSRTMMLEELRNDYFRTGLAKGLSRRRAVLRHGLPNALIPILTLLGIQVASLLSGSVILEQIFGIPGLGRFLLDALNRRDYPVIQGIVLVTGFTVIGVNFIIDVLYGVVDPRVRLA
jgi:peptide/nickel transport system permease protein